MWYIAGALIVYQECCNWLHIHYHPVPTCEKLNASNDMKDVQYFAMRLGRSRISRSIPRVNLTL